MTFTVCLMNVFSKCRLLWFVVDRKSYILDILDLFWEAVSLQSISLRNLSRDIVSKSFSAVISQTLHGKHLQWRLQPWNAFVFGSLLSKVSWEMWRAALPWRYTGDSVCWHTYSSTPLTRKEDYLSTSDCVCVSSCWGRGEPLDCLTECSKWKPTYITPVSPLKPRWIRPSDPSVRPAAPVKRLFMVNGLKIRHCCWMLCEVYSFQQDEFCLSFMPYSPVLSQ